MPAAWSAVGVTMAGVGAAGQPPPGADVGATWEALPDTLWQDILARCGGPAVGHFARAARATDRLVRRVRPEMAHAMLQRRLDGAAPEELPRLLRGRRASEILCTGAQLRLRTRIGTLPQLTDLLDATCGAPRLALVLDRSRGRAPRLRAALAASAQGMRLRELSLAACQIRPAEARALLRCPQLADLTSLHLGDNPLGAAGLRVIRHAAHLAGLRALYLPRTQLSGDDLRWLRGAHHLAGLQTLDLDGNALGARGVAHLVAATQLRSLTRLTTEDARVEVGGVAALLGAAHLRGLCALPCGPTRYPKPEAPGFPPFLAALAPLTQATGLRSLTAGQPGEHPSLSAGDVVTLAKMPHLAGLRSLNLRVEAPGEAGALALCAAPFWAQLTELCLCGSVLGVRSAAMLLTSSTLTALQDLTICVPGHQPCAALAAATQLTTLTELRLCGFAREHVPDLDHLAAAPHLASLRALDLAGPYDGDLPSRALLAATALSRLDTLYLAPQRSSQAAVRTQRNIRHLTGLRHLWLACRDGELESDAPLRLGSLRPTLHFLELGRWRGPTPPDVVRATVEQLAYGAPLPALSRIDLGMIDIGDHELWMLANNRACIGLRELELGYTGGGDVGLTALAHGTGLTCLTRLAVGGSRMTARGALPLARARKLGALEELDLCALSLDEEAAVALAKTPGLPRLSRLGCRTQELPAELRRRLAVRYGCWAG